MELSSSFCFSFQNFAENTMNELLGWYGYDKVELKDGEDIEFRSYPTDGESRQHISVLKGKGSFLMQRRTNCLPLPEWNCCGSPLVVTHTRSLDLSSPHCGL